MSGKQLDIRNMVLIVKNHHQKLQSVANSVIYDVYEDYSDEFHLFDKEDYKYLLLGELVSKESDWDNGNIRYLMNIPYGSISVKQKDEIIRRVKKSDKIKICGEKIKIGHFKMMRNRITGLETKPGLYNGICLNFTKRNIDLIEDGKIQQYEEED